MTSAGNGLTPSGFRKAALIPICFSMIDLFQDHQGNWWMVFLGVRKLPGPFPQVHTLGRETFLAPVTWDEHGWPRVNQTGTVTLDMEGPLPPSVPVPDPPARDNFDTPRLPYHWNFLRNPDMGNYTYGDGVLILRPSPVTLDEPASPTFLGRRQQHHHCRAVCHVERKRIRGPCRAHCVV